MQYRRPEKMGDRREQGVGETRRAACADHDLSGGAAEAHEPELQSAPERCAARDRRRARIGERLIGHSGRGEHRGEILGDFLRSRQ